MYGLTKAVRACTSAKDFVKIVRRAGGEPITVLPVLPLVPGSLGPPISHFGNKVLAVTGFLMIWNKCVSLLCIA